MRWLLTWPRHVLAAGRACPPPPTQRTSARTRSSPPMATAVLELPDSLLVPTSIRSISHKSRSWGRAREKQIKTSIKAKT